MAEVETLTYDVLDSVSKDQRANVWISYRKFKKSFIDIYLFCVSYGVKSSFYVELLFSTFDVSSSWFYLII